MVGHFDSSSKVWRGRSAQSVGLSYWQLAATHLFPPLHFSQLAPEAPHSFFVLPALQLSLLQQPAQPTPSQTHISPTQC